MRGGPPIKDITGQRFGRLVAVKVAGRIRRKFAWECACDCGNTIRVVGTNLRSGNTKSCGCSRLRRRTAPITPGVTL